MTAATLISFCVLVSLSLISTAEVRPKNSAEGRYRKRTVTDPVSDFFSELGNLVLDVDRVFTVQTAPKVEYEDRIVSQIFRPSAEYFSNVQKSYSTLQKRLGALIRDSVGPKTVYRDRDLSTVSPPALETEEEEASASTYTSDDVQINSDLEAKHSIGITDSVAVEDMLKNECDDEVFKDPIFESYRREKCLQKHRRRVDPEHQMKKPTDEMKLNSGRADRFFRHFESKPLDDLRYDLVRRRGDAAEPDSKPEGRIIGDVLYSESFFDRNLRELLRDHGRWILDNPLLTRWRRPSEARTNDASGTTKTLTEENEFTTDGSTSDSAATEFTELPVPTPAEHEAKLSKSEEFSSKSKLPLKSASYYRILNGNGLVEEEVDIVVKPGMGSEADMERKDEIQERTRETVILAFTPDGVPLKLRMGPEINNPVVFLHKVLKSGGVSLNVPVESYDDIEPVGKEVLKFGAGVLTRAIYLDLSNADELKSFLKTLMKSKASGKVKF